MIFPSFACAQQSKKIETPLSDRLKNEPIQPINSPSLEDADKIELGKKLFFDPRLSRSGSISCANCHNFSMGGADGLAYSVGYHGQLGNMNAPTVLNSGYNFAQFWNCRAKDLQQQALGPIVNPLEMANTLERVVAVVTSIPEYQANYLKVYHSPEVTSDNLADAIATFEKTLTTPNSRFDRWLKGDDSAITLQEKQGYALFKDSGCISCHNGASVGGQTAMKLGLYAPYITKNPSQGRYDITKDNNDKMVFKVPNLRNIALTGPYFHDGGVKTLDEAVTLMGRLQLDKKFTDEEKTAIIAFLKTLTGDLPQVIIPQLPPSTPLTPQAE